MKTDQSTIKKADEWTRAVWQKAIPRWSVRSGQDKSYRCHVAHPAVVDIMSKRRHNRGLRILDLGCGDGIILDDPKFRELIGDDGAYLGVDVSDKLLEIARDRHIDENVSFVRGNLSDPDIARRIIERGIVWDVLLSVYVIQELPDIESFIMNLAKLVQTSAYVIIVTVHPDFAGWLKQTGSLKLEENLTSSDEQETSSWRWAGYYPIVDEPNDTFTLPHFHRTVGDYRSLLGKSGFVVDKVLELPDKQRDLPHLVKQGFSPFSQFENNVYWPRIGEEPSALAIISRKETVSG